MPFLRPQCKLTAPLSPRQRCHHHREEKFGSGRRALPRFFLCIPIYVNEMRVQRNWAGIQVWQRNEDQEMEEFNEWSWAAVCLCFPSMWQTAQFPALTPKHISHVRMYSKCLIRTCSVLPQDDKCGPLSECAVWIWMDVSVFIRFWIISLDLNESPYVQRSASCCLLHVSATLSSLLR